MITKLTINIPAELRRRAHAKAALQGETVSEIVRAALQAYIDDTLSPAASRLIEGHELRDGDTLLTLIGSLEGGPADLSSNKHAHAVE
jgi:hypothetical protein